MRASCVATRIGLTFVDPGASLPTPLEGHLATCLRCQAERARQRRLERELAGLRHRVIPAPVTVGASRVVVVDDDLREPAQRRLGHGAIGALAGVAAVAAGGAAYAAWRMVRRPA